MAEVQHRAITHGLRHLLSLPLLLLLVLQLAASLLFLLPVLGQGSAMAALLQHPQLWGATRLSLFTGTAATLLALACAVLISLALGLQRQSGRALLGPLLAMPHAAFAIGLGLLVAPAGLLARGIAQVFTGWSTPPDWPAPHDAWGLSLVAALVLKETPFLLWTIAAVMAREDLRHTLPRQLAAARSLGHGETSAWLRVALPQLLALLRWPLLAVFTYGLTVVDVAIVIGPTQPPTLAQLVWTDLNDADAATNLRGAAGVLWLTAMAIAMPLLAAGLLRAMKPAVHRWYCAGPSLRSLAVHGLHVAGRMLWPVLLAAYVAVALALVVQSISVLWPFPNLLPAHAGFGAWSMALADGGPLLASLVLALASSVVSVIATVAWLESQPARWDGLVLACCAAVLCLPALLLALGQYRLALSLNLSGTWAGLLAVHALPAAAYVFLLLQEPFRKFDPRWQAASAGLGRSTLAFLWQVKWPMLKASLWQAWAVGFAVSAAQYVPAQLLAAGRHSTLPMEAVTRSAGGDRALFAAYALCLLVLPLVAFSIAARAARPRWRAA